MTWTDDLHDQLVAAAARRRAIRVRGIAARAAGVAAVIAAGGAVALGAAGGDAGEGTPAARTATGTATTATQTVAVLNATRVAGLAGNVATYLSERGWRIEEVGNAPLRVARTVVYADDQTTAGDLASALRLDGAEMRPRGGAALPARARRATIVVVLGADALKRPDPPLPTPLHVAAGGPRGANGAASWSDGKLRIQASRLPAGDRYAIWVGDPPMQRFIGFAPPVTAGHPLNVTAVLERAPWGSVLVTVEPDDNPVRPGRAVLEGHLPPP